MKIEELDLSVRAYNCLKRAKIDTVEQLQQMTDDDLLRIRNMGTRTVEEIRQKVVYSKKPASFGDTIRSMNDHELADFIASLAYKGETPWCVPFRRAFCDKCVSTECDFTDGKCPHGSDIEWWLKQPAEQPRVPSGFFLDKEESGLTEEA